MQKWQTYLSIIGIITSKIRQLQYQNGLSRHQVDIYLIATVAKHFHLQTHDLHDFCHLISVILHPTAKNTPNALLQIIQLLEIQLVSLTLPPIPIEPIQEPPIHASPRIGQTKYALHIATEDIQQMENPQYQTPKQKVGNIKIVFRKAEQSEKDLDVIQQNIRQTLDRTQKLRAYLNFRQKEDAEKCRKIQPQIHSFGGIFE